MLVVDNSILYYFYVMILQNILHQSYASSRALILDLNQELLLEYFRRLSMINATYKFQEILVFNYVYCKRLFNSVVYKISNNSKCLFLFNHKTMSRNITIAAL